jgi:phosphoglycerate dehydrogenase-like enzyme
MVRAYYPQAPYAEIAEEENRQFWQALAGMLDPAVSLLSGPDLPDPADYQILISGRPTAEQLEASPNLETLLIPWAGLPPETAERIRQYPHIAIHNLHHNAISTAETALTLLLTAAKHLMPIERRFRALDWRPRYAPNPAVTLYGKTILILGYGSIGRHLGKICAALGMRVLGVRREPQPDETAEVFPPEALPALLPQANVLAVTLPLTDETRGMIGAHELSLLPDRAIVVNVGRGPVIDQHALYRALRDGSLHSAGLDVWYNYPPDEASRAQTAPAEVPFHELENVVMSPHRGGGSSDVEVMRVQHLAEFLNQAAAGGPLPNRVNLERGY